MSFHLPFLWLLAIIFAGFLVLVAFVVLPNIAVFRSSDTFKNKLVAAEGNTWKYVVAYTDGLRAIIVGVFGSLAIVIPDVLSYLKTADWSGTALAQYTSVIGLVCIIGMAFFHSVGLKSATLAAPPADGN